MRFLGFLIPNEICILHIGRHFDPKCIRKHTPYRAMPTLTGQLMALFLSTQDHTNSFVKFLAMCSGYGQERLWKDFESWDTETMLIKLVERLGTLRVTSLEQLSLAEFSGEQTRSKVYENSHKKVLGIWLDLILKVKYSKILIFKAILKCAQILTVNTKSS